MEKKRIQDDQIGSVALLTVTMLAAGLSIAVVGAHPSRCSGARRSVRLQFAAQQAAIEKSIAEDVCAIEEELEERADGR